jgi:uncharacterized protein
MAQAHQGTAHIMGASSGIGAICAGRLPRRGYNLGPVARRHDRLIALAAKSYFPRQAGHRPAKGVLDL